MSVLLDVDRACLAISTWLDKEVCPQLDGLRRFGASMLSTMVSRHGANFVQGYAPHLKMLGLMTDEDKLNWDEIKLLLENTFEREPKFHYAGLAFTKDDVQKLGEVMKSFIPATAPAASTCVKPQPATANGVAS